MRVAVFFAAMLAAALDASAQSRDPSKSPACSFLTKEDAAAALGEAVTGPQGISMPNGVSSCEYSGSGIHKVQLNVTSLTAANVGMYKAMCAQMAKDGLTGLGDVACWYNDKHEELNVVKGQTFFSIEIRRSGNPTEAITGVAKKVNDRVK